MTDKNPTTIDDLAATVDGLAAMMQRCFETMDKKFEMIDKKIDSVQHHLEARMDQLFDERTFDVEEKESIIAAAETYNQQLGDSSLGKNDIMLTRPSPALED